MIEFSEESGSPDLPHYIKKCKNKIGKPDLVICLDSGAGDYKRFWTTTSLRGLIGLKMRVDVIKEGVPMQDCGSEVWFPYCYELANPVWPTAFYETVLCTIFFLFLWKIRKKINISGLLFCIYLILNGIERFMIEKVRINNEYDIFNGITQAEIISFCLLILGIVSSLLLIKNNKKTI